jgi:hypothetical protein
MANRKQIYKITYPNGKFYVGMDLTETLTYFGSPSAEAKDRIVADLDAERLDLTVRKEILWESQAATDAEVRAMEIKLIRETGANDPAIGYNLSARWSSNRSTNRTYDGPFDRLVGRLAEFGVEIKPALDRGTVAGLGGLDDITDIAAWTLCIQTNGASACAATE